MKGPCLIATFVILLLVSLLETVSLETQPPVAPNTLYMGNAGPVPSVADPAEAYDIRSQELIFNVYDRLIMFGAPVSNAFDDWNVHEQYWEFSPSIAANVPTREDVIKSVSSADVDLSSPTSSNWSDGSRCIGWVDNNATGNLGLGDVLYMVESDGSYRTWFVQAFNSGPPVIITLWRGRYVFNIRTDPVINFVNETGDVVDTLNVLDTEYSFERGLVQDQLDGPMWMYYRPLFDQLNSDFAASNTTEPTAMSLAHLIDDAVETSGSDLIINVGIPFPDMSFKQILCGTWASIVSKEFSTSIGCWNGDLYTDTDGDRYPDWWTTTRRMYDSPYDLDMRYCGTGPYFVASLDYTNNIVRLSENVGYWKGWPSSGVPTYLVDVEIHYVENWTQRRDDFIAGNLDICEVPPSKTDELLDVYGQPVYPQIKTIKNLLWPLDASVVCFTFTVDPSSSLLGSGHFPDGIPTDFFNNTHVRKAFAYAFNHTEYIQEAYEGEATWTATPLVNGLYPDYRTGVTGYDANFDLAEAELKSAIFNGQNVWETGFTVETWYTGTYPKWVEKLNEFFAQLSTYDDRPAEWPGFVVDAVEWNYLTPPPEPEETPIQLCGWSADYADADDFIQPYMHSFGIYASFQNYTVANGWGSRKDLLLDLAEKTADGSERAAMYAELQGIYINDCPSFPIAQPIGRKWLQYWVRGWYYNALYPSDYYYHLFKMNTCWADVTGGLEVGWPDGHCGMRSIGYIAQRFGARAPDPTNPGNEYDSRWAPGTYGGGGADVYGDRKIDMRDIGFACAHFLHTQEP